MSTVISHVLLEQTRLQSTVPGGPGEDLLRLRGSHGSPPRRSRGWVSKDFIGMTRDGEVYIRCVQKQKGLKQHGYLGLFKELSVINAARVYKAGQRRGWRKQAGALGCRTCTRRCAKRFVMQVPSIISPPTSLASLPDLVPPSMMVLCVRVGGELLLEICIGPTSSSTALPADILRLPRFSDLLNGTHCTELQFNNTAACSPSLSSVSILLTPPCKVLRIF